MMVFSSQLGEGWEGARVHALPLSLFLPPLLQLCRPVPCKTSERTLPVLSLVASLTFLFIQFPWYFLSIFVFLSLPFRSSLYLYLPSFSSPCILFLSHSPYALILQILCSVSPVFVKIFLIVYHPASRLVPPPLSPYSQVS